MKLILLALLTATLQPSLLGLSEGQEEAGGGRRRRGREMDGWMV